MKIFAALFIFLSPAGAVPPQLPEPKAIQFEFPKVQRFILSNGIVVHFLEDHELPQIQFSGYLRGGDLYEPGEKTGLAGMVSSVLTAGGTKSKEPDAVTRELEQMGSSVGAGAGAENLSVSLFSLTRNFDRTLELFSEIIREPRFDAKKLEVEKKQALGGIARRNDEPRAISRREFTRMLYGPQSPWGRRTEIETIKNIHRKDLIEFHSKYFRPKGMILAVSGDIKEETLKSKLEAAIGSSKWSGDAAVLPSLEPVQPENRRAVYLVEKPNVQQTAIRLGHFGVKRHNPDHFALEVMNEILGGGFSSRLFRNVRSRKGLAYSVGSGLSEPMDYGIIMAGIGTKTQSTAQAIKEVLAEIQSMKKSPPSQEEMGIAKGQLINSFYANFRFSHQIVSQAASLEYFSYPSDWLQTYQKKIFEVTPEQVLKAAVDYWKPDHALILAVGDSKNFDKDLSFLGPLKILNPESGLARDAQASR